MLIYFSKNTFLVTVQYVVAWYSVFQVNSAVFFLNNKKNLNIFGYDIVWSYFYGDNG